VHEPEFLICKFPLVTGLGERDNGLSLQTKVVLNPRLQTSSLCLGVAYGSRHDTARRGGLAHVLEHLLMSAPLDGGPSFCERVESMGGIVNAETGLEHLRFYARAHADDTDEVAGLLLQAVLQPMLAQEDLDRERKVVLEELAAAEADPNDAVQDAILAALFPAHPLGLPVGGSATAIRRLSIADITGRLQSEFLSRVMTLAVVGPRPPTAFCELAKSGPAVSRWPAADVPLEPVTAPVTRWPDEYSWICAGARSPARGDPERHAYQILATLVGSGASSLMYRRLRNEMGLAYAFHAWERGYSEAGAWRVLVGADRGNGEEILRTVRNLLGDIAEAGPTGADLAAARRQAEMRLILDAEDPMALAQLTAEHATAGEARWSVDFELAQLKGVTAQAVAGAAARVLQGLVTVVRPEGSEE
jgi:predicted Zn-dependent peptidase